MEKRGNNGVSSRDRNLIRVMEKLRLIGEYGVGEDGDGENVRGCEFGDVCLLFLFIFR